MRILLKTIGLFLLLTTSCSEFLVVEPDRQVSITEQFSSREGIFQAVNGMYYSMEGILSDRMYLYGDLLGGNLTFTPSPNDLVIEVPPGIDISRIYEFQDVADNSDMEIIYDDCYGIINEANLIIQYASDNALLTEAEADQVVAEALACRAFMHYIVAIHYAQNYSFTPAASHPGIVYNTRTIVAGVDFPSRLNMAETYSLMKEDFESALSLFSDQQALDYGPSYSYFNRMTTAAVYAKAALQMNDWESAYRLADSVILNAGISLMDGDSYINEWDKPEDPVSEVILELSAPRTSDDGQVSSSIGYSFFNYVDPTNYNEFVASGDLLALYDTNDIRRDMFLEIMLPVSVDGVVGNQEFYFTRKFQDAPGLPLSRMSEMYLIRAEAAARIEGANLGAARSDLNVIRERAGLDPVDGSADLLEEIFLERRRELAFEGFLFFDIARYQKDVERDLGCIATTCNLSYPSDYFVLPIPESSTSLNENMEQNEGY